MPARRLAWVQAGLDASDDGPLRRALEAEHVRDLARNASPDAVHQADELLPRLGEDEAATRGRVLLAAGVAHGTRSSPESLAAADRAFTEAAGLFRLLGERQWESEALSRVAHMVNYHGGRPHLAAEQQAQSIALLPAGSRDWAIALTYYSDILDHLGRSVEAEAAARDAWMACMREALVQTCADESLCTELEAASRPSIHGRVTRGRPPIRAV